ncbi:hypothetical protein CPB83DRAFT_841150 [Crepidotus variabilis]|uniref:Uncharacterized protein n=1 Tax=Crepidotus variabilis TaxID=179855 RepID=A0A9P6JHX7_9AGAR|nr:hypothetical protein CPB83DRAFT_841150 [Crepidotus variabilis]
MSNKSFYNQDRAFPPKPLVHDKDINKTNGNLYLINGDLVYSPNSARAITIPSPLPHGFNLFLPPRNFRKSAEWFCLWMGLLLYSIACAESQEESLCQFPALARTKWANFLVENGAGYNIDNVWVDELITSNVATFQACSQVGIFVHLTGDSELFQPDPAWFCQHGVPVWYRWTSEMAQNNRLARIIISKTLTGHNQYGGVLPTSSGTKRKDRQERIGGCLQKATFSPGKSSSENILGHYERLEIPKRDMDEIFDDCNNDKCCYDDVQNEWNICAFWSSRYDKDDNEDSPISPMSHYEGDIQEGDDMIPTSKNLSVPRSSNEWGPPSTLEISSTSTDNPEDFKLKQHLFRLKCFESKIVSVLEMHFGYTPLLPLPPALPIQEEAKLRSICVYLGFAWNSVFDLQEVFGKPSVCAGVDFFSV